MVSDMMLLAILFLGKAALLPVFYHSILLLSLLLFVLHLVFVAKLSATISFDKMYLAGGILSKKQLVNIVSPFDDLWKKSNLDW